MAKPDFRSALDRTDEVELATMGRVSHRQTSRPVWFVRQDDTVLLLPINGSGSQWYRNVLATPRIHLTADGAEQDTEGKPVTDPDRVRDVVDEFRAKYGADQVARYYGKPDVAVLARIS